ncbi:GNAT family N-acetyltransferase [Parapedobacter lycopersici]|uniref:GNAT family N-acetyltransferase n=1 Tax=Parapedobacter lycopersici TaxID=1864939 RepID=UPI00214DAC49|nr:GNAT family N-acetyltransferase [Parapedobacter lycopersici]
MTERPLTLTKYNPADFDNYYELVRSDILMQYITGKGLTEQEARTKFRSIMEINEREEKIGYFKVYDADGIFIGDCKLERYQKDQTLLEIGYILKKPFWRMGYGTMICTELLALADAVAPTVDVIGIIDPDNAASKRLLERFNFRRYFIGDEDDLPTEKLKLSRPF